MAEPGAVACVQFADDAVPLFGHHYPSFANSFGPFCGPRFGRGRQASPPAARHRICLEHYLPSFEPETEFALRILLFTT